jgi:methylthioribose-1-phosphate isomerase
VKIPILSSFFLITTYDYSFSKLNAAQFTAREEKRLRPEGSTRSYELSQLEQMLTLPEAPPAFDVTPAELVTALITEIKVVHAPNEKNIKELFSD